MEEKERSQGMKRGRNDRKHQVLITGAELRELKELDIPGSIGLDLGSSGIGGSILSASTDGT